MAPPSCPGEDTISEFASGGLDEERRAALQTHADQCAGCHRLLAELARTQGLRRAHPRSEEVDPLPPVMYPGQRFEAYRLRARLGAGAMGEVWLADDLGLERHVALKVLLPGLAPGSPLLQDEALALARLSHPNVVMVFDAGEWAGIAYVAMEYVVGATLAEWLTTGRPAFTERLDALVQAGRGLSAVHQAGLVHRDFKPSNVLVGADGRVRVSDFGLARRHERAVVDDPGPAAAGISLAGTPAYLAPELLDGRPCSPASDQYAFCVSLHEALHGARPGEARPSRTDAGSGPRVPAWLHAIVKRGLRPDPSQRFASMAALLAAIASGQARRRRWRLGVTGAGIVALTAVGAALSARPASPCSDEAGVTAPVWNAERAASLADHFEHVGGAFGRAQWERTAPLVADYVARWRAMRRDSCVATRVRGEQSDSLFDRRRHCLDRRLAQLDSLLASLGDIAQKRETASAVEAAMRFASLDACRNSRWLSEEPMPAAAQAAAVAAGFTRLDRMRALSSQGRHKEALEAGRPLLGDAEALGHAPLTMEVAYEIGSIARQGGDLALAESALTRCAELAARLKRPDRLFEAEVLRMRTDAYASRVELAIARSTVVARLAELSDRDSHPSLFQHNLGAVLDVKGDYTAAIQAYRRALALLPPAELGGAPEAQIRQGLGIVLTEQGAYDEATRELRRNVELREKLFGATHPLVAVALDNLGGVAYHRGDYGAARRDWRRALEIEEAAGSGDYDVAFTVGNLALAQMQFGELADALASFQRAVALTTRVLGHDHPSVARVLANESDLLAALGRFAEAEAAAGEALAIRGRTQPAEHPDFAATYAGIGAARVLRGRYLGDRDAYRAALAPLTRAIAIAERMLAPGHKTVVEGLVLRSQAYRALGDQDAARRDARRAHALGQQIGAEDVAALAAAAALVRVALPDGDAERGDAIAMLASRLDREHLTAARGDAALALAEALMRAGRPAQAESWLTALTAVAVGDRRIHGEVLARDVTALRRRIASGSGGRAN